LLERVFLVAVGYRRRDVTERVRFLTVLIRIH